MKTNKPTFVPLAIYNSVSLSRLWSNAKCRLNFALGWFYRTDAAHTWRDFLRKNGGLKPQLPTVSDHLGMNDGVVPPLYRRRRKRWEKKSMDSPLTKYNRRTQPTIIIAMLQIEIISLWLSCWTKLSRWRFIMNRGPLLTSITRMQNISYNRCKYERPTCENVNGVWKECVVLVRCFM